MGQTLRVLWAATTFVVVALAATWICLPFVALPGERDVQMLSMLGVVGVVAVLMHYGPLLLAILAAATVAAVFVYRGLDPGP